jgi:hypothetical protein
MEKLVEAILVAAEWFAAAVSGREEQCRRARVLEAETSGWDCQQTRLLLPLVDVRVFAVFRHLRLPSV